MKKGLFIAIEGIDGAGKNTICSFMKNYLESQKLEVVQFAYPDYLSIWGKIIECYLNNKIELNINEQFFVYFIDILKNQDEIREILEQDKIVIMDRYFSSTVAFQCAKGFNYEKALSIMDTLDVIKPDITIFVQITPQVALERKFGQKKFLDRHEKDIELLEKVDRMYEELLNKEILSQKWIKIDGSQDLKIVKENILYIIKDLLISQRTKNI